MPKRARVSIITRTKDRPVLLQRAFESVASQTFNEFQWVVVNDGGERDGVQAIVDAAAAAGMFVTVVHNPQSLGMEAASNRGIKEAEGEFLVIHDDDDSWQPEFLQQTVSFLDNNVEYGGVVAHALRVFEKFDGKTVQIYRKKPHNKYLTGIYLADMAETNHFPPISFLFKREIYDELGGFNEDLPVLGDWDFHLRYTYRADIGVVREPLANYHIRPAITTASGAYGNTVTAGADKHQKYDALLRNKWLREDLQTGKFGLGTLVAIARMNGTLRFSMQPLTLATRVAGRIVRLLDHRRWFGG